MNMFKCQSCGSTDFKVVVHPGYTGTVETEVNEHDELIITAGGQTFVADLMFINQFGVCEGCGATKKWDYYFPDAKKSIKEQA